MSQKIAFSDIRLSANAPYGRPEGPKTNFLGGGRSQ